MLRTFLLVIVGLAGDPEHGELFQKWGTTLADTAQALGVAEERVLRLTADPTKTDVEQAIGAIASRAAADDVVFVVLIGHGSFDGRSAKFNLKGPDLTAADFDALLRRLPSRRVVLANTASASGPFKDELAGPGRTIVTATRSGAEQYATLFGGYFVEAFRSENADLDKNQRVTVQEAFDYATRAVEEEYKQQGLLATEHAVLDDTGQLAAVVALGTAGGGDLSPDPAIRALQIERREIEQRVEALKLLKGGLDPAKYDTELEKLLTALALKSREIRQAEGN